jgi:hypothetical protein
MKENRCLDKHSACVTSQATSVFLNITPGVKVTPS